MLSTDTRVEVAVGLVYPPGDLSTHLRDALRDLGANIVYEAATTEFDRAALDRTGAQVVVVNLDPDADEQVDAIDELLVDDTLKVVFNDGEVSSKLSGYDLARWARHLASKIVGDVELLPPRPAGAEAVPVRSMPQHALTTSDKPHSLDAPKVSDQSMREATDAIADALASFDMHATKIEEKNAPLPAADLGALLGDFGLAESPSASATQAADSDNPFADLGLALDFDTVEASSAEPAITPSDAVAGPVVDDLLAFADLDFDVPDATSEVPHGLDDLLAQQPRTEETPPVPKAAANVDAAAAAPGQRSSLLDGLTLSLEPQEDGPAAAAAPAPSPAVVDKGSAAMDFPFDLDGLSLEPLTEGEAVPAATVASAAPTSPTNATAFAAFGLSLEPIDGESQAAAPAPTAKSSEPAAVVAEDSPFEGLDFSFDDIPGGGIDVARAETPTPANDDKAFAFSLEDTVELDFEVPAEPTSSTQEEDFMREFAAMTSSESRVDATPASAGGALSRVWVLGASIGGPDAVREFLAAIPPGVAAAFVLAQHMGADFVDLMVAQLQKATRMPVAMAESGMHAADGQVLVVPIAERMLLDPTGEVKVVAPGDSSPYSPSIDRVLIDIADRFGANAGAIIFSGMAHDAIEGAKYLAARGGQVWVQDPSTCVVSSMIDGAMEAGIVGFVGMPVDLAAEFARRFGKA